MYYAQLLLVILFFLFGLFSFSDRVSLYSPGCARAHSVDQVELKLRNPPASASQVQGLKACTTASQLTAYIYCTCINRNIQKEL